MEAAAALERFSSPGKGSGLRSRRRMRPGELLYRAEPFAYVVTKEQLGGVCERCLRRNEHLHRCSQCKVAKYCGKSCQKEAWLDHKQECRCLKSIEPNFPPDSVRLAGRIVFKLLRQSVCLSERLYSFSDLQSNIEQLSEEMKDGLRHLAETLQLYLKTEIQDASRLPPAIDFFQIFTKVTCNCFTISNGEMQDVGVGLYPSMSLLNHSCDPNCVIVFEGYQLLLRSVREIQIGEELTISYIESLMPTSERQKQLIRQYCFECDCLLCQNQEKDAEKLAGEEHAWKEVKDAVNEVRYPKSKEEWEQVLARCQNLLSSNMGHLPDTNIYQLKMLDCAMDACINLESWEEALYYGSRTLGPYRLYYPGFHPLRAVQLMRVGKLQYSQDMFPEALETLKQAYNIMKVTHGTNHSLIQALMEIKEQCEAIMRTQ
ncbi:histone-lysine N-methyltransferase SMYD3 isoform X1 [Gymnogyps californianus]|uniref:histone-lysine N-methyltransferase SMYD3 isoform X1 n=2 Tax=Gymnogyps californianus TaxID=33616 RepID=UPI0021C83C01|nr:histone-lysine N-methyltransferase SMYD3 isoform X1 [Gymnogyps californianus]